MDSASAFGNFVDIEQEENLSGILELLADSGYFRAKIQGLSAFDKIVGGMVWCISLCAGNVDVDLLYSENSTLGQKISLTEKIVKVLPELKCPFSLEPHQIQGMDSVHIYPVIKWLVEEASFVRERLGDETLNFAVYQFGQQGWKFSDELERMGNSGVLPLVKRGRKVYKRVMRMRHPNGKKSENLASKSGEVEETEKGMQEEEEEELVVQGMDEKGEFVYSTGGKMADAGGEGEFGELKTMEELEKELEKLEFEEEKLDSEIGMAKQKSAELAEELGILRENASQFEEAVKNVPKEMLNRMKNLLAERDELRAAESAFKSTCREELANLDRQIEAMANADEERENGGEENSSRMALKEAEQKVRALYAELVALNGEIAELGRKVGAKPSQAEMGQYQRRFVELCNQMVSKHRETKRQYTLYNTLVDVRNFTRQEIDLLDNIDRQKDLAIREEYGDTLLENLQKIAKGIDQSLDKKMSKKRALQEERDHCQEQMRAFLDKHRLYTKTLVEFQQECQRNELLRQAVEELEKS